MEKLNELAALAEQLGGEEWVYSRTTLHSRGYITGRGGRTIVQTTDGDVPANVCRFMQMADPATILAIAKAFRALEKEAQKNLEGAFAWQNRAEAAEAKLAELEKQEPVVEVSVDGRAADDYTFTINKSLPNGVHELFTRPAPAAILTELVPDEMPTSHIYHGGNGAFNAGKESGWNACRAAILRNIEEAK